MPNPLWYPLDFADKSENPTVSDAIAIINTEAVATAINAKNQALNLYQDIIKNQNRSSLAVESRVPFTKIGQVDIPVVIPPAPPIPQPTILVTPKQAVVQDVVEGTSFGDINDATITVAAFNDDLTVYGIITLSRDHWTLTGADGIVTTRDPLFANFDLDNFPTVIPKNTWKAFGIKLNPREGTIGETQPFTSNEVIFVISDATNTPEDSNLSVTYYAALSAHPEYTNLTQYQLNRSATISVRGNIIPLANPGPSDPDTRIFPGIAPTPPVPGVPLLPDEARLGSVGYAIGGDNQIATPSLRQMSQFNFSSESVSSSTELTTVREWSSAVGTSSYFFIVGGSSDRRSVQTDLIDRHDIASDTTIRTSMTLDVKADMLAGATAEGKGYLFGGDAATKLDPVSNTYGTLQTIRAIDFGVEELSVLGAQLATPKALVNCATGDKTLIQLFGGGERNSAQFGYEFYDHVPVTNIDRFVVETQTLITTNTQISANRAWRLASAGNRDYIYLAGGMSQSNSPLRPNQVGLSSDRLSRYSIATNSVTLLSTTLAEESDSLIAFGGSKQIYFSSGFTSAGSFLGSKKITKLDNLNGLNSEILTALSATLPAYHDGGTGISDYSAGH